MSGGGDSLGRAKQRLVGRGVQSGRGGLCWRVTKPGAEAADRHARIRVGPLAFSHTPLRAEG